MNEDVAALQAKDEKYQKKVLIEDLTKSLRKMATFDMMNIAEGVWEKARSNLRPSEPDHDELLSQIDALEQTVMGLLTKRTSTSTREDAVGELFDMFKDVITRRSDYFDNLEKLSDDRLDFSDEGSAAQSAINQLEAVERNIIATPDKALCDGPLVHVLTLMKGPMTMEWDELKAVMINNSVDNSGKRGGFWDFIKDVLFAPFDAIDAILGYPKPSKPKPKPKPAPAPAPKPESPEERQDRERKEERMRSFGVWVDITQMVMVAQHERKMAQRKATQAAVVPFVARRSPLEPDPDYNKHIHIFAHWPTWEDVDWYNPLDYTRDEIPRMAYEWCIYDRLQRKKPWVKGDVPCKIEPRISTKARRTHWNSWNDCAVIALRDMFNAVAVGKQEYARPVEAGVAWCEIGYKTIDEMKPELFWAFDEKRPGFREGDRPWILILIDQSDTLD